MKRTILLIFALVTSHWAAVQAQTTQQFFDEADALFGRYVKDGKVDYAAITKDPSSLNSVLKLAEKVTLSPLNTMEYKAFWINAYNLFVIKGVVDNLPLKSPLDVDGFFKSVEYDAGGSRVTLDAIENSKLRGVFDDARIHFVLVCGAKGCPPLISIAYTPKDLERLLDRQTRRALNDPNFIRVSANKVELSEIFKWYKEDFVKGEMTELDFINSFRSEKISNDSEIAYYPYNWSLNSK